MNKGLYKTLFVILLIFSAAGIFLYMLFSNAVNLPFRDDWTAILLFLNTYIDSNSICDKFNLIVESQNDHRIAWIRLVSLAVFKIVGMVNFKMIIFIGTLALFIILLCLWISHDRIQDGMEEKLYFFLPIVLFLLQPMYSENWFHASGSVSAFYTIAFGITALLILDRKPWNNWIWLIIAFTIGTMGFFSQREGLSFLIAGTILLLFKKNKIQAAVWTILSGLIFLFYQYYRSNMTGIYSFSLSIHSMILSIAYLFTFIGNNFGINAGSDYVRHFPLFIYKIISFLPVAAGIVTFIYITFLAVKRYDRKNPFISSIIIALLIIALGASLYRDNTGDALVSRYRIVTIFFIITIYISSLEIIENKEIKKWVARLFVIFGLLFSTTAYLLKIKPITQHKYELVESFKKYQQTGGGLESGAGLPFTSKAQNPESILKESIRKNIWKIPGKY